MLADVPEIDKNTSPTGGGVSYGITGATKDNNPRIESKACRRKSTRPCIKRLAAQSTNLRRQDHGRKGIRSFDLKEHRRAWIDDIILVDKPALKS